MYPNYMNKPSFMTNTSNTTFGASTSSFGQPAANTPMFSSMQPSNIFQTPSTSSFNAGPSTQTSFVQNPQSSEAQEMFRFGTNTQQQQVPRSQIPIIVPTCLSGEGGSSRQPSKYNRQLTTYLESIGVLKPSTSQSEPTPSTSRTRVSKPSVPAIEPVPSTSRTPDPVQPQPSTSSYPKATGVSSDQNNPQLRPRLRARRTLGTKFSPYRREPETPDDSPPSTALLRRRSRTDYQNIEPQVSTTSTTFMFPSPRQSEPGPSTSFVGMEPGPSTRIVGMESGPSTSFVGMEPGPSTSFAGMDSGPSTSFVGMEPGPSTSFAGMDSGPSTSFVGMEPGPSTSFVGMEPEPSTSFVGMEPGPSTSFAGMEPEPSTSFVGMVPQPSSLPVCSVGISGPQPSTIGVDNPSLNIEPSMTSLYLSLVNELQPHSSYGPFSSFIPVETEQTNTDFFQPVADVFSSLASGQFFEPAPCESPDIAMNVNGDNGNGNVMQFASSPHDGANLFGQQQQPSTSGLFGSSNTFGQNKASFGFGSTPSQTGLFGQQPPQQTGTSLFQPNTSNLFGSTNAFGTQGHTGTVIKFSPVTGTDTMQKNGVTQSISTKHHCITCMKEYENKSLEELRFEDYSCNRKGPQQQTGFSSAPFGSNTGTTSTSLFGQTDNKQGFGQTPGFGQTSTFGQSTPGFGVTNQTNTPSIFGKPAFGTTTTNTTTFGFNPPATSNPFSASQAPKPFSQPLFGTTTTQPQTGFGTGVFGQTNTQNTTSNLFQKPAQPTTGFNTGQSGFSFNQTGTTQASNLFNASKPTTGFGIFGQSNTGTTGFGQTSQPTFGTNFGKLTTTSFAQPTQPAFGTNLGGGLQQPSLFSNTAKPNSLFGNTTAGGSLFSNNVFQQTPTTFSLNMNQQQPIQFPPEPSDESKNISLIATDSFPDGPHVYGLEPVLGDTNHSTTNPQDIKAVLDYSKKREEFLGTRAKIKVHLPKPKRGSNFTKEFFDTNTVLKSSHKCLVIRKFNENSSTIYNKYKNDLIEEVEECLKAQNEKENGSSPRIVRYEGLDGGDAGLLMDKEFNERKLALRLFDPAYSDEPSDDPNDAKSNKSFGYEEPSSFIPLGASSKANFTEPKMKSSISFTNTAVGLTEEDATVSESDVDSPSNVSTSEVESTENPAGVVLTRPEYYIYPALKDLQQYMDENGECIVQGLTIGRKGYGNVYFPDPVNITNMNLDEIVHFRHREVIIYPDDSKKPPVGEGLNRRAQVTLDKIFPREKGTNNYITDVNQIIQSNFVDNLMHVTQKHNCKFVDYRPKTGSWVFKVKHFSKYAFTDSDEEECEVANGKSKEPLKKIEEIEEPTKIGLGGARAQIMSEAESLITEPALIDYWPEDEEFMLPEDIYHTKSAIQTMKASLFADVSGPPSPKKVFKSDVIKTPDIPSEVISSPKVYKIPDISLLAVCDKVTSTQRCYADLGIFRNNTYKVGWSRGFHFYNFDMSVDVGVMYNLTQYTIQVENKNRYNSMMPNLIDMLNVTLSESEFRFDDGIPTLHIKRNLAYLEKQTKLFNDHVLSNSLSGKDKYLSSVWNLCTALWGKGDDSPCGRRQNLSDWLKRSAYDLADDWNLNETSNVSESEAFKTIFKLLSFHKIKEACEFAIKNNLNHLSLLISQLSANERYKFWMRKCLTSFAWKEKNVVLDDYRKVYLLLAGVAVDGSVNVCENLDWMRCFGFHLWYGAPAAAPIQTAFKLYKGAFEEQKYASDPIPPYCESFVGATDFDLLYHILAVYCDCTYQLCRVLHPETHTDKLMDYRLSWLLLQLFQSLEVGLIRESEKEHLHTTFSTQLENMGHWKWAIFPLLYLENNVVKKNLIFKILDRNLSTLSETNSVERELVKTFKIPPSWIHEVKAIKAKAAGRHYDYFQHYLYIEDYHEANLAFITYILPELFINQHYEYLRRFLNKMGNFSEIYVNWNIEGGLFQDFLELYDILHESNEDAVKSVVGKLTFLFRRIKCFPVKNDEQKLCVAELSRQCALLFKLLHKSLDSESFQAKFVHVLNDVLMPPDIKHFELFYLISKYVQQERALE